jgi:hypothetical protein
VSCQSSCQCQLSVAGREGLCLPQIVLVFDLVLDFLNRYRSKADCVLVIVLVVVVVVVLLVGEAIDDDEDEHD